MSSTARPFLMRQSQLLAASRRLLSTNPASSRFIDLTPSLLFRQSQSLNQPFKPRLAPFSTSSIRSILPPGPQVIQGGINDPAPVPRSSALHGSYHWTAERAVSVALIPLTIVPFAGTAVNPTIDAALIFLAIIHSHIGFTSCIVDYFPTPKHSTLRTTFDWLLNIMTVVVLVGFYEFETNDVGISEAIKRIWTAGRDDPAAAREKIQSLANKAKDKVQEKL